VKEKEARLGVAGRCVVIYSVAGTAGKEEARSAVAVGRVEAEGVDATSRSADTTAFIAAELEASLKSRDLAVLNLDLCYARNENPVAYA